MIRDNIFSIVELFEALEKKGIYSTRTICGNCIELPEFMKNLKAYKKTIDGDLEWRIY